MKKSILILAALLFAAMGFAQNGKGDFGATPEDSVACVEAMSLYREFIKQKNYKDAKKPWAVCWNTCPKARKFIHTDGEKMYKQFIKENKENDEVREPLIDTLMMVYDKRIEAFDQRGFVLEKKGSALASYRKDAYAEAFKILQEAAELQGTEMSASGISQYYRCAYYVYKKDKAMEKAPFLELYNELSDIIEQNIDSLKLAKQDLGDDAKKLEKLDKIISSYESAQGNLDKIFSKEAECPDLVELFTPKFEATPDDAKLRSTILKLLNKRECYDNALYPLVVERDLADNPSANGYLDFAKYWAKNDNCSKALEFLRLAAEQEAEDDVKIEIFYTSAQCHYNNRNFSAVRDYCRKVLAINPNHGMAYILIGDAYAQSKIGGQTCEQKAKFWAAYDKYARAKSVDPEVATLADKKMAGARANFPGKTDCFFLGLNDGDPYKVEDWIQETTTVRTSGE